MYVAGFCMSWERGWEVVSEDEEVPALPCGVIATSSFNVIVEVQHAAAVRVRAARHVHIRRSERCIAQWDHIVHRIIRLFFKRRCWSFLGVHLKLYAQLK